MHYFVMCSPKFGLLYSNTSFSDLKVKISRNTSKFSLENGENVIKSSSVQIILYKFVI